MTKRRKGGLGTGALGRGEGSDVETLLPHVQGLREQGEALREVAPEAVETGRWQPRVEMEPEALERLSESVEAHGILEPLLVRATTGGFELLAGERRLRAAKLAGLRTVPVRVLDVGESDARAIALTENLAREDLSPWEEAKGLEALRGALEGEGQPATGEELARLVGWSTGKVSQRLTIADALTEEVLEASGLALHAVKNLPKAALLGASRGRDTAERAALLRQAAGAAEAPGESPGKAVQRATAGGRGGRPLKPFTLTVRERRVALNLRRPPAELEPAEARELVERFRPVWQALTDRAEVVQ